MTTRTSSPEAPGAHAQAGGAAPWRLAIRGDLLDIPGDVPLDRLEDEAGGGPPRAVRFRPDHWLLVEQGRIVGAQQDDPGPGWERIDHRGRLILPGFIDAHVHSAQIDVIGAWGTQLLDWLTRHTFPAEQRMADPQHARRVCGVFLDALLQQGTTAACVFPTVHDVSVQALFEAAEGLGMRLIAGKVLMDRHAPPALCDDPHRPEAAAQSKAPLPRKRFELGQAARVAPAAASRARSSPSSQMPWASTERGPISPKRS